MQTYGKKIARIVSCDECCAITIQLFSSNENLNKLIETIDKSLRYTCIKSVRTLSVTQQLFICLKLKIETLEIGVKYIQS